MRPSLTSSQTLRSHERTLHRLASGVLRGRWLARLLLLLELQIFEMLDFLLRGLQILTSNILNLLRTANCERLERFRIQSLLEVLHTGLGPFNALFDLLGTVFRIFSRLLHGRAQTGTVSEISVSEQIIATRVHPNRGGDYQKRRDHAEEKSRDHDG